MKTFIFAALFAGATGASAFGAGCPKSSEKEQLNKTKKEFNAYQPPAPAQGGATGNQSGDMGSSRQNAGNAGAAAAACAAKLHEFEKKFSNLKDEFSDPECSKEKDEAEKLEQNAAAKAAQCEAAGAAANKQENKNKDNEKKMGDDKKGGDGKAPEMPKLPEKKEEKKEDLVAKERERQAKIKECKARVNNALEIKKRNCEAQFPYNPAYPVANMKQQQDECKQTLIFANQSEVASCEHDPATQTAPVRPYVSASSSSSTATRTSTSTSTGTHSSTISTNTSVSTSTSTVVY